MTRTKTAALLGCSLASLYNWEKRRELHAMKGPSGRIVYNPLEVHKLTAKLSGAKGLHLPSKGEIAACVCEMLDHAVAVGDNDLATLKRRAVKTFRITFDDFDRLYEGWQLGPDERIERDRAAAEEAAAVREREHRAQLEGDLEKARLRASAASARADRQMLETVARTAGRRRKPAEEEPEK